VKVNHLYVSHGLSEIRYLGIGTEAIYAKRYFARKNTPVNDLLIQTLVIYGR